MLYLFYGYLQNVKCKQSRRGIVLYNDSWHGFWVRPWWPRVLWQAVMLWLVNRGMAMRRGRPVEQVCNRTGTTWYENHTVKFRQSQVRIESRARDTQQIINVSAVSDVTACKGVQSLAPLAPWRRYGERRRPLSEYMSLHLSLSNLQQTVSPFREWNESDIYL